MTFILPCPSEEQISLEKKQIKHTSQEKDRGLSFLTTHRRGDFFSFPCQVLSPLAYGAESPSFQLTGLYSFVTILRLVLFSTRKVDSPHPCGNLFFFGIKRKMDFPTVRKHVKPHLQTEAVQ